MNVLVINCGSSSLKYQLISMPDATVLCTGLVDRIGQGGSTISHKSYFHGKESSLQKELEIPDHDNALLKVTQLLTDSKSGVIKNTAEIEVVGHRVVHGGEEFAKTSVITEKVKQSIKDLFALAPLHNPKNFLGIETAEKVFKGAKQVAVFDTAFHQSMPPHAFRFAIPNTLYNEHKIRAYGFHGTSHKYVSAKASQELKNPTAKLISLHLGNGCSISAIRAGKCLDTSMGFGPMSGLIMGTRCGDLDGSVIFHLIDELGYSPAQARTLLNSKSGMLGLSGESDLRKVKKKIEQGDTDAKLAYDMYAYRIKKYIGAYIAVLNGLDALIFTGGVGENDALMRELATKDLEYLGIELSSEKNNTAFTGTREINAENSRVKVLVVPTNEEIEIATQCYELLA